MWETPTKAPETAQDKFHVLIDKEYKHLFEEKGISASPFMYNHIKYYKVPTCAFFKNGGVFKNLDK